MKRVIVLLSVLGLVLFGRSSGAEDKLEIEPYRAQEIRGILIALGVPNLMRKPPHYVTSRPVLPAQAAPGGSDSTDSAGGASGADSSDKGSGGAAGSGGGSGAGGSTGDGSEINCADPTPCCCLLGSHAECGDTDSCSAGGGTCITSIPDGFVKTGNRCRKNP